MTKQVRPGPHAFGRTRRIIVSGVTGLVGQEFARQLKYFNVDLCGLVRRDLPPAPPSSTGLTLYRSHGDINGLIRLFQQLRPEMVVHFAALARRAHEVGDVGPIVESNILFGTQLLEACRLCDCKYFVTAESILQFSRDGEYRPFNLYAATKLGFAEILAYYAEAFGVAAIALVLPTIYSEKEVAAKLMTDTARALLCETTLNLGDEDVPLDLVHVEDVASGFIQSCLLLDRDSGQSRGFLKRYWISSGTAVTPTELVKLFETVGEKKITVIRSTVASSTRRERPYHGPTLPGWSPKIDLESGIRRMLSIRR